MEAGEVPGKAVIDGRMPVRPGQRLALCVRDRDQRHLSIFPKHWLELGQIQSSVKGCYNRQGISPRQRKSEKIQVRVNDVEIARCPERAFLQHDHGGVAIEDASIEAQRLRTHRFQSRGGFRIPAGEEGDVMSHAHQFFGDVRDYPFSAPVEFGGTLSHRGATCAIFMSASFQEMFNVKGKSKRYPM